MSKETILLCIELLSQNLKDVESIRAIAMSKESEKRLLRDKDLRIGELEKAINGLKMGLEAIHGIKLV